MICFSSQYILSLRENRNTFVLVLVSCYPSGARLNGNQVQILNSPAAVSSTKKSFGI